jgi:D-lyxose ketol-isomerase
MKRSEINKHVSEAIAFFKKMHFELPPFASFSPEQWHQYSAIANEIIELQLGWDITDFGLNDFKQKGLILFTLRNGLPGSKEYAKSYAEKIMIVDIEQRTPLHFHWQKTEDIINRGGGNLVFELYNSTSNDTLAKSPVSIQQSGLKKLVNPGEKVALKPGEWLTLPPRLYHTFYGEGEKVLVGEVSSVNNDTTDNRFFETIGRFPEIDEDEPPQYLLCTDYSRIQKPEVRSHNKST